MCKIFIILTRHPNNAKRLPTIVSSPLNLMQISYKPNSALIISTASSFSQPKNSTSRSHSTLYSKREDFPLFIPYQFSYYNLFIAASTVSIRNLYASIIRSIASSNDICSSPFVELFIGHFAILISFDSLTSSACSLI